MRKYYGILYPYLGSKIMDVWNSRPEFIELDDHVRTNNWHSLGIQLGLDHVVLDGFKSECLGDIATCRKKMFALWLRQTEPKPTRQKLLGALRAKAVCEMYMAETYELYIRQELSKEATSDIPCTNLALTGL